MALDELSIIDRFFRPLAGEGAFGLLDDAAQLNVPPDCDLVVTTDMIAIGVHFLPRDPPETIARKALRVNLSDLAAKGAKPLAYTLALGLAADAEEAWLSAFAEGLRADRALFAIGLLGGDTISVPAGPIVSVTAFGCAPKGRMVHRFGGRPGDALYVSGTIGASAAGLALLKASPGPWDELPQAERAALIERYRVPEPRTTLASAIADFASAAMDISDGLIGDCDKLVAASRCSALIEVASVPLPPGLLADEALLSRLLTAGDDYEILAAVPPENEARFAKAAQAAGVPVARIGTLAPGHGPIDVHYAGRRLQFQRRSYVHGESEKSA